MDKSWTVLQACEKIGLFSKQEIASVNKSYAHIKALRFMLNILSNSNRIGFESQLLLAKKSRLRSSKKSSAVEKFMRIFFLHASNLSDFNEFVFQAYEDQLYLLKRPFGKDYYIFKDRLGIAENIDLAKRPELILSSFIEVGKHKKINGLDFQSIKKIKRSLAARRPQIFEFSFFSRISGFFRSRKVPAALGTSCYPYSILGYRFFIKKSIFEKSKIL